MSRKLPTRMTPEVENKILKYLRSGMGLLRILDLIGIDKDTLYKHKKNPRNQVFSTDLQLAMEEAEALMVGKAMNGERGWQGAAWLLGKRNPSVYGVKVDAPQPVQHIEISTPLLTQENKARVLGEAEKANAPAELETD